MPAARAIGLVVCMSLAVIASAGPDAAPQDPRQPPPPTFRNTVEFVRVDAIVTDGERPVTDLTQADFDLYEDGKPQAIEQFRVVSIDRRPAEEPSPIRTRSDVEREAARDDVRMFAIVLSRAISCPTAGRVREALEGFVRTHLSPSDMVAIVEAEAIASALWSTRDTRMTGDLQFTRDHHALVQEIRRLGNPLLRRAGRAMPAERYLESLQKGGPDCRSAGVGYAVLEHVAFKLNELRQERKSIVFVGGDLGGPSLTLPFYELITTLNRTNTAMYVVDTGGLWLPTDHLSKESSSRISSNFGRTINLRAIAEATGGMAIVNTNNFGASLRTVAADASFYYLLGYTSSVPNDGRFHDIDVRVRRRGVQVRSRAGFLALSPEPARHPFPALPEPVPDVRRALASLDPEVVAGRRIETRVATEAAGDGHTRVVVVWEPLPGRSDTDARACSVSIVATDSRGAVVFRAPEDGAAPFDVEGGPKGVAFVTAPGQVRLRLSVADPDGEVVDTAVRTIDVPDFTRPRTTIGEPRVYRARNAREFRLLASAATVLPVATRQFLRTEHLLIRFDSPASDAETRAALLDRLGRPMRELVVSFGPDGDETEQVDLSLSSLAPGAYVVEITPGSGGPAMKALVAFGVRN